MSSDASPMSVRLAVVQGIIAALDAQYVPVDVVSSALAPCVLQMYTKCSNAEVVEPLAAAVARAVAFVPSAAVLSQVCVVGSLSRATVFQKTSPMQEWRRPWLSR